MELKKYLQEKRITREQLANRVGVTQPFITQICNKQRRPSADVALAIEKETGGKVTLRELLFPPD